MDWSTRPQHKMSNHAVVGVGPTRPSAPRRSSRSASQGTTPCESSKSTWKLRTRLRSLERRTANTNYERPALSATDPEALGDLKIAYVRPPSRRANGDAPWLYLRTSQCCTQSFQTGPPPPPPPPPPRAHRDRSLRYGAEMSARAETARRRPSRTTRRCGVAWLSPAQGSQSPGMAVCSTIRSRGSGRPLDDWRTLSCPRSREALLPVMFARRAWRKGSGVRRASDVAQASPCDTIDDTFWTQAGDLRARPRAGGAVANVGRDPIAVPATAVGEFTAASCRRFLSFEDSLPPVAGARPADAALHAGGAMLAVSAD